MAQNIGDRIAVVSAEGALRVGTATNGMVPQGTILTVRRVNGEWSWVHWSEGTTAPLKGWVHCSDAFPLAPASHFFAEQLKRSPSAKTHTILGAINVAQANTPVAIEEYSQALRLDPKYKNALAQRARLWLRMKKYDNALADYNEIIRQEPVNAEAYCGRGLALYYGKDQVDEALADCSEAIRLEPNTAWAYKVRAGVWEDKGEYDKAIVDHNTAARLDPNDALTYFLRGFAWLNKRDYEKAIADFDETLRLNPGDVGALYCRGIARMKRQEYDKAIADLTRTLQLDPKSPYACWGLTRIFATCPDARYRNGAKALEMATRRCELTGWDDWTSVDNLAAAYAESGNFEAAVGWEQKAVRYAPEASKAECKARLDLYQARKPFHRKANEL